jgi:hypothetical protein
MIHTDETKIELFVLGAPQVDSEREGIEAHLRECAGCREIYEELVTYYSEVEKGLEATAENVPSRFDKPVQLPARVRRSVEKQDRILGPPSRVEVGFPIRAARWVVQHRYASGGGALGILTLALILMFLVPKLKVRDLNPYYVTGQNDSLLVLNREGQLLWRGYLGYDLERARVFFKEERGLRSSVVEVIDIDKDGSNEIIVVGGAPGFPAVNLPLRDLIFCYNSDGSMRWKGKMGREVVYGNERFTDDYLTVCFQTGNYDDSGGLELLVYAHHSTWEPAVVSLLNAEDGSVKSEYWHRGHIQAILTDDLDRDGIKEILIAGQNNSFNSASIIVLDTRYISGYAPTTKLDTLQGGVPGIEKYFILIPMSDVGKIIGTHVRNIASEIRLTDKSIIVEVIEGALPNLATVSLYYRFDKEMRCLRIDPSDVFRASCDRLLKEGKLRSTTGDYYEDLRKSVLYWDGDQFVNKPTLNKKYLEAVSQR